MKDNKRVVKENIKDWYKKHIWVDMFEEVEIDESWLEECAEEYYNGYVDGIEEDVSYDTHFDWDNITKESVINWSYNKGLEDRY